MTHRVTYEEMDKWVAVVCLESINGPEVFGENWYGQSMRIRDAIRAALLRLKGYEERAIGALSYCADYHPQVAGFIRDIAEGR